MAYGRLVLSTIAHGRVVKVDANKALALKGVIGVLTAKDLPQKNIIVPFVLKDTLLNILKHLYPKWSVLLGTEWP